MYTNTCLIQGLKKNSSECSSNRNTIESSDVEPVKLVTLNEFKDTATTSSDADTTAVASGEEMVNVLDYFDGVLTRS
jgi:hypothetical protein